MLPPPRRLLAAPLRRWLSLTVRGADHVPATGPCLVASTHASHADNLALGIGLGRPVHFLGSASLESTPIIGRWLTDLGMVPVQRGGADLTVLATLQGLLQDGQVVVLYPEGSRSRDGRVYRPRSGIARLAADTGIPVVPAAVRGSRDLWPVGQRPHLFGGNVSIQLGAALPAPEQTASSRRSFQQQLHEDLVRLSGATGADTFAPVAEDAA